MKPLRYYKISEITGFAMENPATRLKYPQPEWEKIAENLPEILKTRSLNNLLLRLPVFDIRNLTCYRDVRLARVLLAALAQTLVYEDLQINGYAEHIPRNIAIPFYDISTYLGMQPIQTYSDTCLYDYKLINQNGPLDMRNCDLIYKMDETDDFKWFFLVSLQTEFTFAKYGLKPMYDIKSSLESVVPPNELVLRNNMEQLIKTLRLMTSNINEMYNYVDPTVFYERVRPLMMGWGSYVRRDKKMGIVLDGVTNEPFQLYGSSAVESSIVPAFDELLGIKHPTEKGQFLTKIREYMPLEHREFLTDLSTGINLEQYMSEFDCQNEALLNTYNDVVSALTEFRRNHLKLVARYIFIPSNKKKINKSVGTAGSDIGPFLKGLINDTQSIKIDGQMHLSPKTCSPELERAAGKMHSGVKTPPYS